MLKQKVIAKIKTSPSLCGVYRYFDKDKNALYIGKAKNLSKRLSSYLRKDVGLRIAKMLSLANDIDWIICKNEPLSLLTEALQIKELQPRYNILLKDDKSFLELCISQNCTFNRLFVRRVGGKIPKNQQNTQQKNKDFVSFGPFLSKNSIKGAINVIQKIFLIRDCPNTVFALHKKQKRPCLQYHIKRCSAPCADMINRESYEQNIQQSILFCKGERGTVIKDIGKKMKENSENMRYEYAAICRDQLKAVNELGYADAKCNTESGNIDFIVINKDQNTACFYVQLLRNNKECGTIDLFVSPYEELDEERVVNLIMQFYENKRPAEEVLINISLNSEYRKLASKALSIKLGNKVVIRSAKSSIEKAIMQKTEMGAKYALMKHLMLGGSIHDIKVNVKKSFKLRNVPNRIEVFDNSHLQGSNAIGAMIVADNNGFIKSAYRKYQFHHFTANKGDDYAMMFDMLKRRLENIKQLMENESNEDLKRIVPDLLIIDGGKGHVNPVKNAMNEVGLFLPFVTMAKGVDRNAGKEVFHFQNGDQFSFRVGDPTALYLQTLRDEAHRFAISSHRKKRLTKIGISELDQIEGIGSARKISLLNHFGSVEAIGKTSIEQLKSVHGISKSLAIKIKGYFSNK